MCHTCGSVTTVTYVGIPHALCFSVVLHSLEELEWGEGRHTASLRHQATEGIA